jgi:thioredoxin-like negative regulator of GroEL
VNTPTQSPEWQVICLCAAWCGVCRDWMPALRELKSSRPELRFAWIDVEDEDEAMGDVDIETFPTVLIAQGPRARFLGAVPPSGPGLSTLVSRLQAQAQQGDPPSPVAEAQPLLDRLAPLLPAAAL